RGVLLTGHAAQVPARLPDNVRHFEFASFLELFPLCGAVVHHGGIGTTARALAAGIPQVLLPQAWDQCDNARRIEKIGAGIGLPRRRRRGRDLAAALERVMSPPTVERCRQVAGQIGEDDGLDSAADRIEELARQHGR
ncbi:MAG TPA: nucleotide disphospho-sugar-binding domain-containing protein, partial [Planctomycetaceae bacterium]|nr:nucleotide disphospho-sugar-binding domain-containing protein [Planctomycetaceae bacterium]